MDIHRGIELCKQISRFMDIDKFINLLGTIHKFSRMLPQFEHYTLGAHKKS